MLAHGFTATLLAEVQDAKLATVSSHSTRAGGRMLIVRQLQITEAVGARSDQMGDFS
jgi:hypothetical protein